MSPELARLLQQTSRSLWLSIRVLPGPMRAGVGLGYLLARLTDSVADAQPGSLAGREDQRHWLEKISRQIQGEDFWLRPDFRWKEGCDEAEQVKSTDEKGFVGERRGLGPDLAKIAQNWAGLTDAERELLGKLDELLEILAALPSAQRVQLTWVLRQIVDGQRWDLGRFGDGSGAAKRSGAGSVVCLAAEEELGRYCWRVAGSVGEFWGRLGWASLGNAFAGPQPDGVTLARRGGAYGQALQLINILRDLPEDWQRGRCYLPGNWSSPQQAWEQAGPHWLAAAREQLAAAADYAGSLNGTRLRWATALPAAIGWETLRLLGEADFAALAGRVKVSRKVIRQLVWQGLWAARSGDATRAWLEQLRQRNDRGVTEN